MGEPVSKDFKSTVCSVNRATDALAWRTSRPSSWCGGRAWTECVIRNIVSSFAHIGRSYLISERVGVR
jgi:hypothetical protein